MTEPLSKAISPIYGKILTAMIVGVTLIFVLSVLIALYDQMSARRAFELFLRQFPNLLFISALWYARSALKHLTAGKFYAHTLPKTLNRIGQLCLIGGGFQILGQAILLKLLDGDSYKSILTYDPASFIIMTIGLILLMLSKFCSTAALMKQHLEEIV